MALGGRGEGGSEGASSTHVACRVQGAPGLIPSFSIDVFIKQRIKYECFSVLVTPLYTPTLNRPAILDGHKSISVRTFVSLSEALRYFSYTFLLQQMKQKQIVM
jgi:hypothetical protein